jgi:mRNA interferase MazF
MVNLKRFDVYLVNLDPTLGSEIKKIRPVIIISPDSMNQSRLKTIIVAPMTSTVKKHFPTRIDLTFQNRKGQIALDQIRTIDRIRLIKRLGQVQEEVANRVLHLLSIMFQR